MADLKPVGRTSERTGSSGSPSSSGSSSSSSSGGVSIGGLTSVGGGSGSSDEGKTDAEIRAAGDKDKRYRFNPQFGGQTIPLWADAATALTTAPAIEYDKLPPSDVTMAMALETAASTMTYLGTQESLGDRVGNLFSSAQDYLQTPEYISMVQVQWADILGSGDYLPYSMQYGTTEEMVKALGTKYSDPEMENPSNAFVDQKNVETFFAEHSNKFDSGVNRVIGSIFTALPVNELATTQTKTADELAASGGVDPIAAGAAMGRAGYQAVEGQYTYSTGYSAPNPREQLAAEATLWLRDRPLETDQDERDFMVWLWRTAEEKRTEVAGRESHLGAFGAILDFPKHAVTSAVNSLMIDRYKAPGEQLDLAHVSLGQNFASWHGLAPGDTDAGFLRGFLGDSFQAVAKTIDVGASLYGAPMTVAAWATGFKDQAFGLNIATPFVEELRKGTSYDLISGGVDLTSWLVLDPTNYLFGAGFGMKTVSAIPRPAGLSTGRALMQAVLPFYGAAQSPAKFGVTSRVTWAIFANTTDEMIDAGRATMRGKTLYASMRAMDSPEEAIRKIEGFAGAEDIANVMFDAAKNGDEEFFWQSLRLSMNGFDKKANPNAFSAMEGLLNSSDNRFDQAVRRALDSGDIDIRSVMHPTMGTRADDINPYTFVAKNVETPLADDAFDAGVEARQFKNGPRMVTSPEVGQYATKAGRVTIRGAGDTFAAFLGDEFVGMVEHATSVERQIAVIPEHRRKGIGTLLRSMAGENPERATVVSASAEAAFYKQTPNRYGILTPSAEVGDQQRKAIINTRNGWNEINGYDRKLISWVAEHDPDLAAKLQASEEALDVKNLQASLFDMRLDDLSDEEITLIRRYIDDVAEADAIKVGDQTFVGERGGKKLYFGDDTGETVDVNAVLGQAMYEQTQAHAMKQILGRKSHKLTLVHRMPRVKSFQATKQVLAKWTGLSGKNQVAQFARRFGSGLKYSAPTDVNWAKASEGGTDFRRFMKLMGVEQKTIDDIMSQWWKAGSAEERRLIYINGLRRVGDEVQMPKLKYELMDYAETQGVQSYVQTLAGKEIGTALDEEGYEHVVPVLKAFMTSDSRLPNVHHLVRHKKRYAAARRLPKRLVSGFGKTGEDRKALAKSYRTHINAKYGPKVTEGISDDDLMTIAYSDVMGFQGRKDGLGMVNSMTAVGSKMYGGFHYLFTVGQLAFRPFAWAGRVGLEEHARAWMMGLPTLIRYPANYAFAFYDSHWIRKIPTATIKQKEAASKAALMVFTPGADMSDAVRTADAMLPGFAKKAKEGGINLADSMHLRAQFSHDLGLALAGGSEFVDINSKGNIARRVMRRGRRLDRIGDRLIETYGTRTREFNFLDDAPEIANKSNVWLLSDEMQSSVVALDWDKKIRKASIPGYAHSFNKKLSQIVNDPAGRAALQRMLELGTGNGATTIIPKRFINSKTWKDVRENIKQVARHKGGINLDDEEALAAFYLDDILRDEVIGSMLRPFWTNAEGVVDEGEKFRIISEILGNREFGVTMNGTEHILGTARGELANTKQAYINAFYDVHTAGRFDFPTVTGYVDPLYSNHSGSNPFRRFTNWALQTFGEDVSQVLHRQPAYLAERRRWTNTLTKMGWNKVDADQYGHQKAFELVNYTFFNNQHTGATIQRMNKIIPFFSAWAEVIGTWAWKIPSQNYLPLGYARMFHRMDQVMQGWVKLGLVEMSEDGQWHLNLREDPSMSSPLGKGLSRAGHGLVQTPITVIEQMANTARFVGNGFDMEGYRDVDFSAWKKDNYQLAIGSPVRINDHGIMGVNQFQFGAGPVLNYTGSQILKHSFFAGDTTLISGETLADIYDQMPPDMSPIEILELNKRVLVDELGEDGYDLLMSRSYDLDPEAIKVPGVQFQIPGSSWMDNMVDDLFFPFGHVDTPMGVIREIVPSGISYMLRGLGVFVNDVPWADGILTAMTDPMGEYQISSEIAKQLVHLEASESLISKSQAINDELNELARLAGYESLSDLREGITPGSEESEQLAKLTEDRDNLNAEIMKRASDNAGLALFARGLMGFFAPASPRMFFEEQKATGQWWVGREMAEAAKVRGSIDYAQALDEVEINSYEDLERMAGIVDAWSQDETGDYAKKWFLETYPSLAAWTQGTTYWGPGGPPPAARNLDVVFDQIEEGQRTPYPPDVLMQRIMRSNVASSFESKLVARFGNSPERQFQAIVQDWGAYSDLREEYRMQMKGLDMWDAELNGGSYAEWRDRNPEDDLTLYDRIEEDLYEIQDAMDEILAMGSIVGLDPEDMENMRTYQGQISRAYRDALSEVLSEVESDEKFRNPREEMIAEYFLQVVGPYYDERTAIYDGLDEAETKEERSVIFEEARDLENAHWLSQPTIKYEGRDIQVPNEIERAWTLRSDEEKERQVMIWTGNNPAWLSLFAANKIAEMGTDVDQYVPTTSEQADTYAYFTEQKNKVIAKSRANPLRMSVYERTQALNAIDEKLREQLKRQGRYSEVTWMDSWPIERLMRTGQLDPDLEQIGRWYMGLKAELEAMEKGPTSEAGRKRFLALANHLETVYYEENPPAEVAMDALGLNMFDEHGRYAIYHRLYGSFIGELQ